MSLHSDHRLLFGTVFLGFLALSAIIAVGPAMCSMSPWGASS